MEEDRAEGNLGIAADLEENQEPVVQRQPKKRFVGRRAAAENAAKGAESGTSIETAVQGEFILSSSNI
jgi:2-(3-amino-3-carboxypropyl)histidine synthase